MPLCDSHLDFVRVLPLAVQQRCDQANHHYRDHGVLKQNEAHPNQDSTARELLLPRAHYQLCYQLKSLASLLCADAVPKCHLHLTHQLVRQQRKQGRQLPAWQFLIPHLLAQKFHLALLPSHLCP